MISGPQSATIDRIVLKSRRLSTNAIQGEGFIKLFEIADGSRFHLTYDVALSDR